MRKLLCPQCKVSSMYVKNGKGERRAVYVTDGGVVVARKEGETLDGFDLETVYCIGLLLERVPQTYGENVICPI